MDGGRGEAMTVARGALDSEGRVVIVGPGGVGKSTLARELAEQLAADRTVWLDLDRSVSPPSLAMLIDAVGERTLAGDSDDLQLRAATDERRLAIVIDGADANVDVAIALTAAVPTSATGPWVVITSRVRPIDADAQVVRLGPLDLAHGADLAAAVAMFRWWYERAGGAPDEAAPGDGLLAVLELTGGLPLAIRVAAAYAAATGLDATARLLGIGDGTGELARCLDRSVERLSPQERLVFDAIALTSGRADLDMVAAIAGSLPQDAAAALGSLVRHNLLELDGDGFRMLPPIHRHARARADPDRAAHERFRAWCESIASDDVRLLQCEHDIHLAVSHLLESADIADIDAAMRLQRSLVWAQFEALLQHSADEQLTRVLASPALGRDDAADQRVELLRLLAIARSESRGDVAALEVLDEADHLVASTGSPDNAAARLLSLRSVFRHNSGALDEALGVVRRAAEAARLGGDRFNEIQSRLNEAAVLQDLGRLREADAAAVWVLDACGDDLASFAQSAQSTRAMVAIERGDRATCEALGRRQLADADTLGEAIDAEFILLLADPVAQAAHLGASSRIDPAHPGEWMVYLEAQASLAMQALVIGDDGLAMTIASDIVVIAEALPLFWMRLEGLLLVGDAALVGGARRQAWLAYRSMLSLANEHGFVLRAADAVDGLARLTTAGDLRRQATAVGASMRLGCDADRRPRPWLPDLPAARSRSASSVPDGWVIDGRLTDAACEAIVSAAAEGTPDDVEVETRLLSPAELRVARLVADGCTNREIGERLHISRRTVETHIVHAFQKLDVRNRTQLATIVRAGGLERT